MLISKSEYMLYLKHPAWLWIKKHAKHLMPPVDDDLQARFNEGHAFEPFVESLFPNLKRLGFNSYFEYLDLPENTLRAWDENAEVVSQGRYESGSITCISDIVRKKGDAFILTEIKSSSAAKAEHTFDLAFQKIVLEGAGFPIERCEVAHVNSRYIRQGEINSNEFVGFTDITPEVNELVEATKSRIDHAIRIVQASEMPDPRPERARLKSYQDWLSIRQTISPPLLENSIHFLPFMDAEKSTMLAKEGINTVDKIKDLSVLKKSTQKYLIAKEQGVRLVQKDRLSAFLSQISYPVYYFDYEASQSLVPPWDGTRPYQQVPFQYSLHILREPNGELEHFEYLHRDTSNPMPRMLESLQENVGDEGSILVWYEPYEKSRNNEMAEMYPNFANFLTAFNDQIIDLMKPFSKDMVIDHAFKGSSSIKKVLPALVPSLTYDGLNIQDGVAAARKWKEVTLKEVSEVEREKVYLDLIEYCKLDTLAMVKIHRELMNLCK